MISYRQAEENDFDLTLKIKSRSIRQYIEQIWGWDDHAQLAYHKKQFNPKHLKIILYHNTEVGLIDMEETIDTFFLANILVDQDFQGQGIGKSVMKDIIEQATQQNKKIELQVFKINTRAKKLYEKLGFNITGETDLHYKMRYDIR